LQYRFENYSDNLCPTKQKLPDMNSFSSVGQSQGRLGQILFGV